MGCCSSTSDVAPPSARRPVHACSTISTNSKSVTACSSGVRVSIVENPGRFQEHYDDELKIGEGSFGSVSRAKKRGERAHSVAVKTILKTREKYRQEVGIMKVLSHPNVIKLQESFEDRHNIYLVMELCMGGNLSERIADAGHFTELQACIVMEQVFSPMHYLHENLICHRDMKLENLLFQTKGPIESCSLKLIDFGLSCKFEREQVLTTKLGSLYYASPQVLAGKYDFMSDLWACGVIMFIILCGYPPFHGDTEAGVLSKIRLGSFSFDAADWSDVSEDAKSVIRMLLKMNPRERYTAEQALSHEWVKNKAPRAKEVDLSLGLVDHLRSFRSQNCLKQAALHVIAGQLSVDQLKGQRETFMALDANGDGVLTAIEMNMALMQAGFEEVPEDLKQIVEDADYHGSGVDCTTFLAATLDKRQYMQESAIWDAFKAFDRNGDGMISISELKDALGATVPGARGARATEELLKERRGREIDFQEFKIMMRGVEEAW